MTTFYKFTRQFPDDEACLLHIMTVRYGGTVIDCPSCGQHGKFYRLNRDRAYLCQHCKHHIYPCVGTPMERSRTSVRKWFYAMFLFSSSRHGVAAKELERQLGVTYKCAWRMAHEIRKFMADVDNEWPLDGDVDADETYVAGNRPGKPGRGAEGKTVVFRMLERDGEVMTKVVPNVKKQTLLQHVHENEEKGATVHTDELCFYNGLQKIVYRHKRANHGTGQYVDRTALVNSIEGFWARLKLVIRGTHVHVSGHHLWKYAKKFEFRYNWRKAPGSISSDLLVGLSLTFSPGRP